MNPGISAGHGGRNIVAQRGANKPLVGRTSRYVRITKASIDNFNGKNSRYLNIITFKKFFVLFTNRTLNHLIYNNRFFF